MSIITQKIAQFAKNKSLNLQVLIALTVRFLGMGLQFLAVLVIGRTLGAEDMGVFSLYLSLLVLISAFIGFGSPVNSFNLVSRLNLAGNHSGIRTYFFDLLKVMALVAIAVFVVYVGLIQGGGWLDSNYLLVLPFSLVGAWVFVMLRNAFEFMLASAKTTQAMAYESVGAPLMMITFVIGSGLLGLHPKVTWLMLVNVLIFSLLAVLMFGLTVPAKPLTVQAEPKGHFKLFNKATAALWLSSILDMAFVNVPTLIASQVASMAEVGRFAIAFRFISMIVNLLMVVRGTYGRELIKYVAARDIVGCRQAMRAMQKFGLSIYVPFLVVFIVGGDFLISLFGKSFDGAYSYLLILGVGQLVYAAFGFSGFALVALDESKVEALASLGCIMLMIAIGWLLRDQGATGVAIAYSISMSLRSFLPYLYLKHRLKALSKGIAA